MIDNSTLSGQLVPVSLFSQAGIIDASALMLGMLVCSWDLNLAVLCLPPALSPLSPLLGATVLD